MILKIKYEILQNRDYLYQIQRQNKIQKQLGIKDKNTLYFCLFYFLKNKFMETNQKSEIFSHTQNCQTVSEGVLRFARFHHLHHPKYILKRKSIILRADVVFCFSIKKKNQ